jgi:membrane-bound lytic murein transglycosylase D
MNNIKNIGFVAVTGLLVVFAWLFLSGTGGKGPVAGPYLTTAPYVPAKIDFAGEKVPLEQQEVYERLDREIISNTYYHSNTIVTMKKAFQYFPTIERILKEEGVPDDFKYLCVIESNLSNVVSPAGAAGYWQFMPATGKIYDLEINSEVDERYHLEKSTRAACKYLKEAYAKFNSWTMAAASYNMGMNGLSSKSIEQRQKGYYDLLLYQETQRYVFRILAIKSIFSKPDRYGFHILDDEKYQMAAHTIIKTDKPIDCLICFAGDNKISYKELKWLNPWLREKELHNRSGKTYEIKILKK